MKFWLFNWVAVFCFSFSTVHAMEPMEGLPPEVLKALSTATQNVKDIKTATEKLDKVTNASKKPKTETVFFEPSVFDSQDDQDLRDPTRPPGEQATVEEEPIDPWRIRLIFWSQKKRHALIGNQYVVEGDMIKDYRVLRISQHAVRLRGKDDERTLKWVPELDKQSAVGRQTRR